MILTSTPLKTAIVAILDPIKNITYDWSNAPYDVNALGTAQARVGKLFQEIKIWNNQLARMSSGEGYAFQCPACFLEPIPSETSQFLDNVTYTDYTWRVHIIDEELDAADEFGLDQNLNVFIYRDIVKSALVGVQPPNCSTMFYIDEAQDFEHDNFYHYILDFKSGFTDTKGSVLDADQTKVIYTTPPTNLELEAGFTPDIPTPPIAPITIYIWKVCPVQVLVTATPNPSNTQTLGNGVVIPIEYALNSDGTLTIPYLSDTAGVTINTPFMVNNQSVDTVIYEYRTPENDWAFNNVDGGGFGEGNEISFNASLPLV